jgi:cobalt-zinc-cadmium efflux system protein
MCLGLTILYAFIEFATARWAHSLTLLGDSGHLLVDALALGIAMAGASLSRRPPSEHQTYGWGRAEVIAAAINGLLMLALSGLLVTLAIQRLIRSEPVPVTGWAVLLVGGGGLILNLALARILYVHRGSLNVRMALWHALGDLLGSVAAIASGAVIVMTGWMPIDPLLSLVIAALILVAGLRLCRQAVRVLLEGVPPGLDAVRIGETLSLLEGVLSVHDLHIWALSSEQVALSAHVMVESLGDWSTVLERLVQHLETRYGIRHVTLQPESWVRKVPVGSVARRRSGAG